MTKTLEIDLRSAEGLKLNRNPVKSKTFCLLKIDEKSRESNLDEAGGSNPTWNYKSEIPINGSVQFISVQVCYRTRSGHEKKIGEAKIPTTDFMGRYSPEGHSNFLSYRLRDEFGDKCGIVNVSIIVKSDSTSRTTTFESSSSSSSSAATAMRDYDACSPLRIDGYGGRIVTGVPVWCVYQRPS